MLHKNFWSLEMIPGLIYASVRAPIAQTFLQIRLLLKYKFNQSYIIWIHMLYPNVFEAYFLLLNYLSIGHWCRRLKLISVVVSASNYKNTAATPERILSTKRKYELSPPYFTGFISRNWSQRNFQPIFWDFPVTMN